MAAQTATATYSIVVGSPPPPTITSGSPPSDSTATPVKAGQPYPSGFRFSGTNGIGPYTWTATGLPPGVTLTNDGLLMGTPTTPGTYSVVVKLTDSTP